MEKLSGFVLSLLSVCVISGIATGLSPDGTMKRYIKYVVSLCVLAAIITPVISVFTSINIYEDELTELFGEHAETTDNAEKRLIETQKKAIEEAIADIISNKFGIGKDKVTVETEIDATVKSAIEVRKIMITVRERCRAEEIRNYIEEMFYGTARVTITEALNG